MASVYLKVNKKKVLRGRVARKFNNEPNLNKGKDARFLAPCQRSCTRLIKKHLYQVAITTYGG